MREKELRLALVCYGGVSLAVYMHGVTREVWHLARASRAYHDGPNSENAVRPVERAYCDLLALVEARSGIRLRVLADIVAGASAGGINGVFLARAIATGQSLEPLTDLWLERADIDALIDPAQGQPSRLSRLWAGPLAHAIGRWQGDGGDDGGDAPRASTTRAEVHAKLARFVRARWFEPPFGGAAFDRMLLDAFDAMAAAPAGPRLLPPDQPLDLFVTVTDFHGHPERLPLHSPAEITETEHRLTLAYRDNPGEIELGAIPDLVFAARATASFPGAFPPFPVGELEGVLADDGRDWPGRDAFLARVLPRQAARGTIAPVVLIDGSVLANAPFRPAILALKDRPARREVDRRFVYLDPKPGRRSVRLSAKAGAKAGGEEVPGFFATLFGALSDIPREQPIRDNLDAIAAHSTRVDRSARVIGALRPGVEASVERLFGRTLFFDRPTPARLSGWREHAARRATADAGHSLAAYREVVRADIAERLARPQGSAMGGPVALAAVQALLADRADLSALDLGGRIRRLRFLVRRLSALVDVERDSVYEPLRATVFGALAPYLACEAGRSVEPDIAPARLLAEVEAAWALDDLDRRTDEALAGAIAALPRPARRAPLLAYLGFPFYDIATFPLLQGEEFDEFDAVKVDRIAPEDARSLSGPDAAGDEILKGTRFNSFGAFFSRAYRENDYLWGRLHGAERMIDITVSTVAPGTVDADAVVSAKRAAFAAILDEEGERLTHVRPLIDRLRARLDGHARQPD